MKTIQARTSFRLRLHPPMRVVHMKPPSQADQGASVFSCLRFQPPPPSFAGVFSAVEVSGPSSAEDLVLFPPSYPARSFKVSHTRCEVLSRNCLSLCSHGLIPPYFPASSVNSTPTRCEDPALCPHGVSRRASGSRYFSGVPRRTLSPSVGDLSPNSSVGFTQLSGVSRSPLQAEDLCLFPWICYYPTSYMRSLCFTATFRNRLGGSVRLYGGTFPATQTSCLFSLTAISRFSTGEPSLSIDMGHIPTYRSLPDQSSQCSVDVIEGTHPVLQIHSRSGSEQPFPDLSTGVILFPGNCRRVFYLTDQGHLRNGRLQKEKLVWAWPISVSTWICSVHSNVVGLKPIWFPQNEEASIKKKKITKSDISKDGPVESRISPELIQ